MDLIRILLMVLCYMQFLPIRSQTQLAQLKNLATSNSNFGLKLYDKIRMMDDACNIFLSPLSVSSALSMCYLGAKAGTKDEMIKALEFKQLLAAGGNEVDIIHRSFKDLNALVFASNVNYTLKTANRLYGQNSKDTMFNSQFLADTNKYYNARLQPVDFAKNPEGQRMIINKWVERQTENKIKDLLPSGSITTSTIMVLVNAIYFKGLWKTPFEAEFTSKMDFSLDKKNKVKVNMMMTDLQTNYVRSGTLQSEMIELPYSGNNVSMFVLLPNDVEGLASLEAKITTNILNTLIKQNMVSKKVSMKFPKFKMEIPLEMKEQLIDVGISKAFVSGVADFSGIRSGGRKDLVLSRVDHKAFIQVDEEGTEAAAATGIRVVATSLQPRPIKVTANRPFLFFIRHNPTESILFLGRLKAPEGSTCPKVQKENVSSAGYSLFMTYFTMTHKLIFVVLSICVLKMY